MTHLVFSEKSKEKGKGYRKITFIQSRLIFYVTTCYWIKMYATSKAKVNTFQSWIFSINIWKVEDKSSWTFQINVKLRMILNDCFLHLCEVQL